ncbi:MAG: DNA-binding domain-containing protein [Haliea sp.]
MPVIDLTRYQADFSRVLLAPELAGHEMLSQQMQLPEGAVDRRQAMAEQRLGIYRNNVIHSLTEAMAAQFPVVKKLVGEDFFLALARDYVRVEPPREPALTFYGDTFPDFIASHAHCRPLPYLPDVAKLEWLCQKVRHAADDPLLQAQELTAIDPEQLGDVVLHMIRAAALFSSPYPIVEIRAENLKDEPNAVDLGCAPPSRALVLRRNFEVTVVNLNPSAFLFLDQLRQGHAIDASWEMVAATYSLNEEVLPHLLSTLLGLDVFCTYEVPHDKE